MSELRITQVRSAIGRNERQRRTIKALGLGRIGRFVIRTDRPEIRGMITTVSHLVVVTEATAEVTGAAP